MGTFPNSEDPDEMPHYAALHQGLHCFKGVIKFRINQDFLIEHLCIFAYKTKFTIAVICYQNLS